MTPVAVTSIALAVFLFTYVGMALGRVPGLALDRTGIAVMAVAILLASGAVPFDAAGAAIDAPTIVLMFALMILSAQFSAAGIYDTCAGRIAAAELHPRHLLALVIAVAGGLSAVLVNDIVVFAMAPILCLGLRARGLDPKPYLMALAGAGNAGSAATLIGNPQNILIGQAGHLGFWPFLAVCGPPVLAALACVYGAVWVCWRTELSRPASPPQREPHALNRPQMIKGLVATVVLLGLFATPLPREIVALAVAAALMVSRKIHSRAMIAAVDWQLLLLIACLFVVTGSFAATGIAGDILQSADRFGVSPDSLRAMFPGALLVSSTIGNVPATILILSLWPSLPAGALYGLALLTTLAGNLLLTGSLCNLIVAERAAATGVTLTFGDFARAGIPMALTSMTIAAIWLWAGGWLPL
ncbi:MAG: anion transporter [Rhodospirillaceae bacterium]|nr:anion transporter [Rhodospirillaceae bacterium]